MTKEEIFNKIQKTLAESLEVELDQINLDTDIAEDLKADSISIMEFTLALEDEFDIEVSDEDADKLLTIGNVVDYVSDKL